jgi:hypothetical protein
LRNVSPSFPQRIVEIFISSAIGSINQERHKGLEFSLCLSLFSFFF